MKPKLSAKLLSFLFLLSAIFNFACNAFAAQENSCLTCHENFRNIGKNSHRALVLGCETCHMRVSNKEHPHDAGSIKLKNDLPDLCYNCHKKSNFEGKDVHPPVSGGACTKCHNAHQSTFYKLLTGEPPELCYGCHDKEKFTKKYPHKVALNACGKICHNPHVSENPFLLSHSINDLCTGCHKPQATGRHIVTLPGGRIHPIGGVPDPKKSTKELSCATCHNPHSSAYAKLFSNGKKCKRCHKFY
jgi:predicted CXXCH cytochrome family protein